MTTGLRRPPDKALRNAFRRVQFRELKSPQHAPDVSEETPRCRPLHRVPFILCERSSSCPRKREPPPFRSD